MGVMKVAMDAYVQFSQASELQYLQQVNSFWDRFANKLGTDDKGVWGASDYWATPAETLQKKAGDCEDVAIGKLWNLKLAGYPIESLQLYYVIIDQPGRNARLGHMIAVVQSKFGPRYALDNLLDTVMPYEQAYAQQQYYVHYRIAGLPDSPVILNNAGNPSGARVETFSELADLVARFKQISQPGVKPN